MLCYFPLAESPCKNGNHKCEHICYVSDGANHCACQPGYDLQRDNTSCSGNVSYYRHAKLASLTSLDALFFLHLIIFSDIDECTTGKNRCNQNCRNTIGWYDCYCHPGYRLDTDNVTCVGKRRYRNISFFLTICYVGSKRKTVTGFEDFGREG